MKINQKVIFIALLVVVNFVLGFTIYNRIHSLTVVETDALKSKATSATLKEEKEDKNEIKEEKEIEEKVKEETKEETSKTPVVEKPEIVYDGMTMDELSAKLDRSLSSTLSGYGHAFAYHSVSLGVDPYLAVAIAMHETGCNWSCSGLVQACNNVGGQKGSGCNGYQYFSSLDEGIKSFVENIYYNYYQYGLTTPEAMNSKYAEDPNWSANVNAYMQTIKAS